jgi:hypothetical protein
MIFHTMAEKPEKGQLVFCELPTENGQTAWLIYHFVNKFPFKIIRWFSVDDLEKAEKRINHIEKKIKEAQDVLAGSLNVAGAFIALADALGKTD